MALEDQCPDPPKETAKSCPVGNPISPLTGQKIQIESPDFESTGPHRLIFQRVYRSDTAQYGSNVGSISNTWFHNWQRALNLMLANEGTIMARRADASLVSFVKRDQQWLQADGQSRDYIVAGANDRGIGAWQYHVAATGTVEAYDAGGRLLTVTELNGWVATLTYTTSATAAAPWGQSGVLESVRNQFGTKLSFTYNAKNNLIGVTTPDGLTIAYGVTTDGGPTVTWPDGAVRRYHYGEDVPNFQAFLPGRLTGITDELGVRYSRYTYKFASGGALDGFVTAEEHAGGADKLSFSYGTNATLVTDGNALTRSFNYQLSGKLRQPTGALGSSPIGDPFNTIQYDAGNNVIRTVDRNGSDTRYSYDALGRETQRIEGYGTADAKTTTFEWHPAWNLPLKVAAPGRVDYFTYDGRGQMTAHGWFPTADANGSQGLNAAPSGAVSGNSYGYDTNGLMTALTEQVDGAVTQQWTFGYDEQGNLVSAADGPGRASRAVQYDSAGRLLEAVDLEGVTVKYVYDQRGRVLQYLYGDNVTAYVYDAIGQKVQVTSPNGDVTNYTYDAAHRLIDVLFNGQSLSGPDPDQQQLALAKTTSESAGANPFSAWMGWISKLFNWLFGAAHAQSAPAPAVALGASVSMPGTYTPSPWDVLAPDAGGKKPWEWLAIWTTRLIETCSGSSPKADHRGRIQAQGPGYRDEGVGDVEAWAQAEPLTAVSGLAKLEALEGRMTKKQYQARSQALARARRFVVNASSGGGTGPTKKTFRNDEVAAVNGSERVDIEVQKGMAFVP